MEFRRSVRSDKDNNARVGGRAHEGTMESMEENLGAREIVNEIIAIYHRRTKLIRPDRIVRCTGTSTAGLSVNDVVVTLCMKSIKTLSILFHAPGVALPTSLTLCHVEKTKYLPDCRYCDLSRGHARATKQFSILSSARGRLRLPTFTFVQFQTSPCRCYWRS